MIIGGGTIQFNPDDREATIKAILAHVKASKAEEGCVAFELSADFVAPDILHVFEAWESPEALDAHRNSPHMAVFDREVATSFIKYDIKIFVGEIANLADL